MRALRVYDSAEGRQLRMEEAPKPEPRLDQVLIRVRAIGVNRADLGRGRAGGGAPAEPFIPGLDAAGNIEAVGSEVKGWRPGDAVTAFVGRGGYAEYAIARAVHVYQPPQGMNIAAAASIPCAFLTAWYGLIKLGEMKRGETVLVHAAGSGVGMAGVQIARAWGARVITSAGSDAKVARGLTLGAEAGVNYSTQDVAAELQRLTQGKGVDVVLDSVGGPVFDATMKALAPGGRVVTPGGPAGPRGPVDEQALAARGQKVMGIRIGDEAAQDEQQRGWAQLKAWFESGAVRTVVDRIMSWNQAEEALRVLGDRAVFGKIVLTVDR